MVPKKVQMITTKYISIIVILILTKPTYYQKFNWNINYYKLFIIFEFFYI